MFIPIGGDNLLRRLIQLLLGTTAFGIGIGLMLQSGFGLPPWDVLHEGLTERFGLSVGKWSILISFVVIAIWLPMKERLGIGTLVNAVVIGVMIDVTASVVPEAQILWLQVVMMALGVLAIGVGSGMYIGANLGPGPRDGLMTAIARRGPSIRLTRTVMEGTVLIVGWILGGTVGVGTVAFALLMGPIVQFFLPRWTVDTGNPEDSWNHPAN
ncbi:MAG: hypothetical protein U9N56_04010 [Actinomycetota bacterium]|nr:hypothetical protein [Actinomycetota bacterium]